MSPTDATKENTPDQKKFFNLLRWIIDNLLPWIIDNFKPRETKEKIEKFDKLKQPAILSSDDEEKHYRKVKEIYDCYAKEVEREDNLIRERFQWFLISQGAIVAGFTQIQLFDPCKFNAAMNDPHLFFILTGCLIGLPLLGAAISWFYYSMISRAQRILDNIFRHVLPKLKDVAGPDDPDKIGSWARFLPHFTRPGEEPTKFYTGAHLLPIFTTLAWITIELLVFVLYILKFKEVSWVLLSVVVGWSLIILLIILWCVIKNNVIEDREKGGAQAQR